MVKEESLSKSHSHDSLLCVFNQDELGLMIRVIVVAYGYSSGRHTTIKFSNMAQREEWLKELQSARTEAFKTKVRLEVPTTPHPPVIVSCLPS